MNDNILAKVPVSFSYSVKETNEIRIPYVKIFFNYEDLHYKIKLKGNPYPELLDKMTEITGDYDKSVDLFEIVFKGLAEICAEKKSAWKVFVYPRINNTPEDQTS